MLTYSFIIIVLQLVSFVARTETSAETGAAVIVSNIANDGKAIFNCPESCTCNQLLNHLKCENLHFLNKLNSLDIPHIHSLDISNLGLLRIPNQLDTLFNLTELNLSRNNITEISKLNRKIRTLDLSENRITSGKLTKVPLFVKRLNLTNNAITYLPLSLMKLKKLRSLELDGNPINCTCDTLHVRNWLTSQHVWSDRHIKCALPLLYKGRPWLQIKQSEVCMKLQQHRDTKTRYNWDDYEDDNELMMADGAMVGSGAGSGLGAGNKKIEYSYEDESGNDLEKDYLPVCVDDKTSDKCNHPSVKIDDALDGEGSGSPVFSSKTNSVILDDEGSGYEVNEPKVLEDDDRDDGSGSGYFPIIIETRQNPNHDLLSSTPDDIFNENDEPEIPLSEPGNKDEDDDEDKTQGPLPDLGIFGSDIGKETVSEVQEETVISHANADLAESPAKEEGSETIAGTIGTEGEKSEIQSNVKKSDSGENTFILLGILGLLLIGLIVFVACKRGSKNSRNRRNKSDIENLHSKELEDMDKKLLGKPISKNGKAENAPLISDRNNVKPVNGEKFDLPTYPNNPLLDNENKPLNSFLPHTSKAKSKDSLYENVAASNNNQAPSQNGTTVPTKRPNGNLESVHQSQISVQPNHDERTNDSVFLPELTPPLDTLAAPVSPASVRYSPIYTPASPRSDRYSPVYSPETGRVKIKLTETPKPKTPVLVTRSRSQAGDYITTREEQL